MAGEEEIIATPVHERRRFENPSGDVVVWSAVKEDGGRSIGFAMKGPVDEVGPVVGRPYRFFGRWGGYTNPYTGETERQFHYVSCVASASPKGRDAVVAYLSACDSIGRVIAGRLYDRFGEEAIARVKDDPEAVAAATGRGADCARRLGRWLVDNEALEELSIELAGLLKGRGFPRTLPRLVVKKWGNRAATLIRRNPYRLLEFPGVGFKRADAMYLDLGHRAGRLKRQALCCAHALRSVGGDTWHYHGVARAAIERSIGGVDCDPDRAIRLALRGRLLAGQWTDGVDGDPDPFGDTLWLADAGKARSERRVAREVERIRVEGGGSWLVDWEGLSAEQGERLAVATSESLGILGGSPGTGKTYTAAALVRAIVDADGAEGIAIAAPTGKAAVRCTEAMHNAGVGVTATTIHSLLGVATTDGAWRFLHNEGNPLPHRFFIIDEASMLDADLLCSLLRAIPCGARVLLVGDTNQLLPVGHGAPLRDLIAAGAPCGELRQIQRNSGGVVRACAAIRDGESFVAEDNLVHRDDATHRSIADVMATVADDGHPRDDVQVLCAVNDKSERSRRKLNEELQALLNPTGDQCRFGPYRAGDKVVCLQNGFYTHVGRPEPGVAIDEHGRCRVANGDIGIVEKVEPKRMTVRLAAPNRRVLVPVGEPRKHYDDITGEEVTSAGCQWDMAYALSVHKSQGSEFPVVIVVLDPSPSAGRVGDRAWVYTAISRAKQKCVLWGPLGVARDWCRRDRINKRKTFLRELVAASRAERDVTTLATKKGV